MTYRVVWHPRADNDLAVVWLAATDRTAVTLAAAELEKRLTSEPQRFGESRRSQAERVGFQSPLGVYFEIIEDDKKVVVRHVFAVC